MTALEQKLLDELEALEQSRNEEREAFMLMLKTISEQQKQIIELLKKPPEGDNFKEALDDALGNFSEALTSKLAKSNEQLIEEIKTSLEEL